MGTMTDTMLTALRDIIALAVGREEAAAREYGRLASIAKSSGLIRMLLDLHAEEEHHKALLEGIDPSRLAGLEIADVEDLKISDALVAEPLNETMSFQDILVFAAKKEAAAAAFYDALAARTEDADLKRLCKFLREQEKGHKRKLEIEYERLVLTED